MKLFEVGKTYYCVMASETRSYTVTKRTKDFLFYVDAETGEQYRNAPEEERRHALIDFALPRNIKGMQAAMEKAQGSVHRLGSSWEADDYTQMRTQVDQAMDNVREALEAVKNDYVAVQQIAQGYSVLQQTAVQEFQAAAN